MDSLHTVYDFLVLPSMEDWKSVFGSRVSMGFDSFPTVTTPNLAVLGETFHKEIIHADVQLGNAFNKNIYDCNSLQFISK